MFICQFILLNYLLISNRYVNCFFNECPANLGMFLSVFNLVD